MTLQLWIWAGYILWPIKNVLYFPNNCHKIYIFTLKHFSTHKTWITRFNTSNFLKDYLNGEIASSLELCIVDCRIHRILIFYAISLFSSIALFRTKNNEMISLNITFYIIYLFAIIHKTNVLQKNYNNKLI